MHSFLILDSSSENIHVLRGYILSYVHKVLHVYVPGSAGSFVLLGDVPTDGKGLKVLNDRPYVLMSSESDGAMSAIPNPRWRQRIVVLSSN